MRHTLSPDYLVSCNYTIWSLQTHSNFERHWRRSYADRKCCQYIFCNIFIGIVAQSSRLLNINIYIYVWKLNPTVLELDLWVDKFLFFPRRDLNSHHWYTAAPITYPYVQRPRLLGHIRYIIYIYIYIYNIYIPV